MLIKPLSEGKHNNLHFVITDKKAITFKVVVFLDTCDAYIISSKIKFNTKYLDLNAIHEELSKRLSSFDYVLRTPVDAVLTNFQNTSDIIVHYNLYENIKD